MKNGIVDLFRLDKVVEEVHTIHGARLKYDSDSIFEEKHFQISNRVSYEYKHASGAITIKINGNPWVKSSGTLGGLSRAVLSGLTLGVVPSQIRFVTNDKFAMTKEYVSSIYEEIHAKVPVIERQLKEKHEKAMQGKWK